MIKTGDTFKLLYTYGWDTGTWGTCSQPCGTGTQTRSVTCKRDNNLVVPDAHCIYEGLVKPDTSRVCNTHACTVTISTDSDDSCIIREYNINTNTYGKYLVNCSGLNSDGEADLCGPINFNLTAFSLDPIYLYYEVINREHKGHYASMKYSYKSNIFKYARVVTSNKLSKGDNVFWNTKYAYDIFWAICRIDLI